MSAPEQSLNTPTVKTQPKTLRVLAEVISFICHPIFMPLVMSVVLWKLEPSVFAPFIATTKMWLVIIIISTLFFPLFTIFLMKQLGFISSYKMPTTKDRIGPLLAIMIFYFWVSHVFNSVPGVVPLILRVLFLGNLWGLVAVFIVNIFTKISMHTAVAGGMIGIILVLMKISPGNMVIPLFIAIIIAGIMGTARMILGAHQRGDIWLGYIIGIVVQIAAYFYMR